MCIICILLPKRFINKWIPNSYSSSILGSNILRGTGFFFWTSSTILGRHPLASMWDSSSSPTVCVGHRRVMIAQSLIKWVSWAAYYTVCMMFIGTGLECRRVECKSAKLWGEMVKELSDGVTETQILQKLWKKKSLQKTIYDNDVRALL